MEIIQDMDKAITVMHEVADWTQKNGMNQSLWWDPQNMNRDFLIQHIEPNEFYVAIENEKPAASVILQDNSVIRVGSLLMEITQDRHYMSIGFVLVETLLAKDFLNHF